MQQGKKMPIIGIKKSTPLGIRKKKHHLLSAGKVQYLADQFR
jgi:hypothetical protein